MSTLVALFSY